MIVAPRSPEPWKYACLVSGETGLSVRAGGMAPVRRLRVLNAPAAALGAFAEAVRLNGGMARTETPRPAPHGPGKIADALAAGPAALLLVAASRVRSSSPDLQASIEGALRAFDSDSAATWRIRGTEGVRQISLETSRMMGIVNVTPDSFSDGGELLDPEAAAAAARQMVNEGADIVDIGGESTRPGAGPVSPDEQIARIRPVLESLGQAFPVPISIDTSSASVAEMALSRGAAIINDVTAGTADPKILRVVADAGAGLVLMHMKGTPATMQDAPRYDDLIREVCLVLHERVRAAIKAGVSREQIIIDPGIGFGKTAAHNLEIIARLRELTSLGLPILVGPSRKGFLGKILGLPPRERVDGTIAACVSAVLNGAALVRVHDVQRVSRAVRVARAIHIGAIDEGPADDSAGIR